MILLLSEKQNNPEKPPATLLDCMLADCLLLENLRWRTSMYRGELRLPLHPQFVCDLPADFQTKKKPLAVHLPRWLRSYKTNNTQRPKLCRNSNMVLSRSTYERL